MAAHHCPSHPCPICFPQTASPYYLPPQPMLAPQGCICPPTSEQTCKNPTCPRGGPGLPRIT